MYNPSAERSAGWAGLAFLVVALVSVVVVAGGAQPPAINAGSNAIGAFILAHTKGILTWAWLGFPSAAFFYGLQPGCARA